MKGAEENRHMSTFAYFAGTRKQTNNSSNKYFFFHFQIAYPTSK